MIEEVGAMVHFLFPYSPDFMPIELAFSKVKTSLIINCIVRGFHNYYTKRLSRLNSAKWIVLLVTV